MSWTRKIWGALMIWGLGVVSGLVLAGDAAPGGFTRIMIPAITCLTAIWVFDVFLAAGIRLAARNAQKRAKSR